MIPPAYYSTIKWFRVSATWDEFQAFESVYRDNGRFPFVASFEEGNTSETEVQIKMNKVVVTQQQLQAIVDWMVLYSKPTINLVVM
jgi:hypothetical protein